MKQYRIADSGIVADHDLHGRKRIKQVFRYLQELHRLRTPPAVKLADHEWVLPLHKVPTSPSLELGFQLDAAGRLALADDRAANSFLLRVGRPAETEPPAPSVVLKNWLKTGVDDARIPAEELLKQSVKVRGGARQEFAASEERVRAFETWCEERAVWAENALRAADALALFSDLFDLHSRLERESEKYQLFVADGMLELEHDGTTIRHPLLMQRVELRFDPAKPEFCIVETGDTPEVHLALLRHAGLDGNAIQQLVDAVANGHVHPLGGEATDAVLRDFVQRCWTDGQFHDDPDKGASATGPRIWRSPHLLLGNRSHGLDDNLARYLHALEQCELPTSLLRIVGIDAERPQAPSGDLLFTKPANPEQVEVLRRLEATGAVLVQGPPGTGKSHTIANLVGHLLAQQKSILVTSHASKPLRVVREKLPAALQPLCVSVLHSDDESARQLEESITGIVNQLGSSSVQKLERELEKLQGQRQELQQQKHALQQQLAGAVVDECRPIEVLGEALLPAEAAARLLAEREHGWLPGPLQAGALLPLTPAEVDELYAALAELPVEMAEAARGELPDLASLLEPKDFAAMLDEVAGLEKARVEMKSDLWTGTDRDLQELQPLLARAQAAIAVLRGSTGPAAAALAAGCEGQQATKWAALGTLIEATATEIAELQPLIGAHTPDLGVDADLAVLGPACRAAAEHLDAGGTLAEWEAAVDPRLALFAQTAVGGGGLPTTAAHFWALLGAVEISGRRATLATSWEELAGAAGSPFASLGEQPEIAARAQLPALSAAWRWHADVWAPVARDFELAGLHWPRLLQRSGGQGTAVQRLVTVVDNVLPQVVQQRERQLRHQGRSSQQKQMLAHLDTVPKKGKVQPLLQRFRAAIKKSDYDAYACAWQELAQLHDARTRLGTVDALLLRLEPVAPGWTKALRERQRAHATGKVPGPALQAWSYRQWASCLEQQAKVDLGGLQQRIDAAGDALMERTAEYVEKSSWLAQLRRTGLQQQQALTGWLQLQKKIGKGTGKHVPLLKDEARRTLMRCRSAVPVWIMPLSRVLDSFDLATTRFDVVILDEASQCDVMGLLALALAKEVVVVGDHEQVSPYAVGTSADQIRQLIDELLSDVPNRQLYDGKTSVYDLAQQSFGGTIRLLEHFRCVPDIIRFSNELCYGGQIRPLREATSARVTPALVAHRVPDGVEENGINESEAQQIAALVAAMCRLDEYQDCSIGVISMIGTDQALYIDSLLRSRLSTTEYRRRQILCGNASQFQGDERDVILLSMVNSPGKHALAMRQRDDVRKVFNVAASRARDQLWVVHSLDPGRDLKGGDLRLQLIQHAEGVAQAEPSAAGQPVATVGPTAMLCERLQAAGYTLLHRFKIGGGEIDLVVEGAGGRRVGVECVGDRALPAEEVAERLERQQALRRLGWQFLRVRAVECVRDPERAWKELAQALQAAGIQKPKHKRGKGKEPAVATAAEPLHEKVLQRAAQIRSRWQVPSSSDLLRTAKAESSSADTATPTEDSEAPNESSDKPGRNPES